jgi:hypothetical protein
MDLSTMDRTAAVDRYSTVGAMDNLFARLREPSAFAAIFCSVARSHCVVLSAVGEIAMVGKGKPF